MIGYCAPSPARRVWSRWIPQFYLYLRQILLLELIWQLWNAVLKILALFLSKNKGTFIQFFKINWDMVQMIPEQTIDY